MTQPKPDHLGPEFAAQFADASVVRAYATRPPYPAGLFEALASLAVRQPACVLELGCGTGDLSHGLAARVGSLEAIDPSAAMLEVARASSQQHSNICFVECSAEAFAPMSRYDLVVAAESLHWMDWQRVLPKVAGWLRCAGPLAIVTRRELRGLPWSSALTPVIARYSTNRGYRNYDVVDELSQRGLFRELGRRTFRAPFTQPLDAYVESFHSRNGFSRERMRGEAAVAFDSAVRALVLAQRPDGMVSGDVEATLVWGLPMQSPVAP